MAPTVSRIRFDKDTDDPLYQKSETSGRLHIRSNNVLLHYQVNKYFMRAWTLNLTNHIQDFYVLHYGMSFI